MRSQPATMITPSPYASTPDRQIRVVADIARNIALSLQKQVDAGQITREAARAEFIQRATSLSYDNGNGYLFGYDMEGTTIIGKDPKLIGINRLDSKVNGTMMVRQRNVSMTLEHLMSSD